MNEPVNQLIIIYFMAHLYKRCNSYIVNLCVEDLDKRLKNILIKVFPARPSAIKLRSQILGSFDITKTNKVNLHGFLY